MAFNLFDFSQEWSETLNPFWASVGKREETPAPYARPKAQVDAEVAQTMRRKNVPTPKPSSSFIETASADEGLSDDEINALIAEGYSDEEIQQADDELRGSTQPTAQAVQTPEASTDENAFEKVWGAIQNVVWGAVAEVPNIASNLVTFASGVGSAARNPLSPIEWYKEGIATAEEAGVKRVGEAASGFVKKYGAYQPESTGAKVGEVGAQIGASLAIPGGALGAWYKTAWIAGKVARAGLQWAVETGKFTAVSEWRLPTVAEASLWAGVSAALPLAWKALQAAKTKLQLSGNVNPAKLGQIRNSIISDGAKETDEVVKKFAEWEKKPELVSQWMLDRGITGTKEQMVEKLVNVGESSKKAVDSSLASVATKFKNPTASSALASVRKSVEWVEWMEPVLAKIDDLVKKNETSGLTLSELNEVKREMDRNLSLFTLAGDVKAGNVKQGLANLRSDLRKFIETKADEAGIPNVRLMNNDTSVSHKLAEAIGKKEDADAIRQLVSPFSGGMIGWMTGVWPFDGQTMEWKVGNFLFGALLGSAANSSYLKTKIASGINKMTPSEKGLVNAFIESRGAAPIPKAAKELVKSVNSPVLKNSRPLISVSKEVEKAKSSKSPLLKSKTSK